MEKIPTLKPKAPVRVPKLPAADVELAAVAKSVSARWIENDWLKIQWISPENFKLKVDAFNLEIETKLDARTSRPRITGQLLELEAQMNDALLFVKGYLKETFGASKASEHYPSFGFVHYRDYYRFPMDKTKRSQSLRLMVTAIEQYQFSDKKYGYAFWKDLHVRYAEVLELAKQTDSTVSLKVGTKNVQASEIRDTLNAIINILKGQFPKTWKAELRHWGFHKEKY